ncbi:MAG: DUF4129 domain-containing protein [Sporichthyaceae bacterium]|nr:DUF4129 domain-containing protein [Sporichthyaceae bacterium]
MARPTTTRSWLVPAAVALLLLLAVAGAVARHGLDLDPDGPLAGSRDALVTAAAIFVIVNLFLALLVAAILRRRKRRQLVPPGAPPLDEEPPPWWIVWARRLAIFAFFLLLLAPLFLLLSSFGPTSTGGSVEQDETGLPDDILPTLNSTQRNLLILLAVLAMVLAVATILRRSNAARRVQRRANVFDGVPEVPGLAEAISAGGSALREPAVDARTSIIACYLAMERVLAQHGAAREVADTPAELLDRAVGAGLIRSDAALRLTELFREARFSSHPMGEPERTAATGALAELADDLYAVRR